MNNPHISLTDFVDYIGTSGTPRLTLVRKLKARGEYSPQTDFWRKLRTTITEYHRSGSGPVSLLDSSLADLTDKKKQTNYPVVLAAYKRFLGQRNIEWFDPDNEKWSSGGLEVRVNPELGLIINGQRHYIKLYFKSEALSKLKTDIVPLLISKCMRNAQTGDQFAVLDVRRAKLHASPSPNETLLPLLEGEAVSLAGIWQKIP